MDESDQLVETLGPGADFRHDYDHLANYRGRSDRALARLVDFQKRADGASREELERAVASHLESLRERLFESPYYRETLRRHSLSPRDLRTLDDLSEFPSLTRRTLGDRLRDIVVADSDSRAFRDAAIVRTSGSTGEPIDILRDGYDLLHMWTMVRYWAQFLGVALPSEPAAVLLCALPSGLEYSSKIPTLDDGTLYRISARQPRTLERLMEVDPDILFSDPGGFHWLLGQSDAPDPAIALSSAQYLPPAQRQRASEELSAPIVNYYSTTETGPMAWECLEHHGRFHVLVPDVWVESVEGDLRVTRLRPSVLPLLHYRLGDDGRVVFDRCECGYTGWSIVEFRGRRRCEFIRPDDERVDAWQFARFFKYQPLNDFRMTQKGREVFLVELVGAERDVDGKQLREELRAALRRSGWEAPHIEIEYVKTVEAQGNKPRPFRRNGSVEPSSPT